MQRLLKKDLDHILEHTCDLWKELKNERVFTTGATGFIGSWLVESYLYAVEKLAINSNLIILTRNLQKAKERKPHIAANPRIEFREGDVRTLSEVKEDFGFVIHAATDASARLNVDNPIQMFETIVQGTMNILKLAQQSNTRNFLFISSGAVYGKVPEEILSLCETLGSNLDITENGSAYGVGKASAEYLCQIYGKMNPQINIKIARCFAFVGPYLPLDQHFAIGNFIQDGLENRTVRVKGDGTPIRSYLYAADLAIWLWTILFKGEKNVPYNVGSENGKSIAEIAKIVAECFDPPKSVSIAKQSEPNKKSECYLPSTSRARIDLNLKEWIDLEAAIQRTIEWHLIS